MRIRPLAAALLVGFAPLAAQPAAAQASRDEPRITLTVGLGYGFGRHLWTVSGQPYFRSNVVDTFNLSRRLNESLNAYFSATYFQSPHFGFNGEFALIGLGTTFGCADAAVSGSVDTRLACQALNGTESGGAAVLASFGPIVRANSRGLLSPFLKANVGIVIGAASTIEASNFVSFTSGEIGLVRIYEDSRARRLTPGFLLAGGFVAQVGKGYTVNLEVRDNIVRLREVTAPTPRDGQEPPSRGVFRHVPVISVGFGVVLEKRRGRRY